METTHSSLPLEIMGTACSHNHRMTKNNDGIMEYLCKGQQRCRCRNNNMVAESQKEKGENSFQPRV